MSKSNTTENDVLKAILQGTDPSWRTGANLYLAFYTADPNETGTATTNETVYTNYARQTIVKATAWTDGVLHLLMQDSFSSHSVVLQEQPLHT